MTKIKICGLKTIQDIQAVNEFLPEYIGFVFADSRRAVNPKQAEELKNILDRRILSVGVFVNASQNDIIKLCKDGVIDLVQLHGDEDKLYIGKLKNEISNQIIKAVRIQSSNQILEMQSLPCDYLLLDTYEKDVYGGSGKKFDWSLIPNLKKPFFLAGGLNTENITTANTCCHPYCLDVSSGVETEGIKDRNKIKEIIDIVRCEN